MKQSQTFIDKCYKNSDGKVVLAQFPNLPIVFWALAAVLARIVASGAWHNLFNLVSFGALFTWCWLEIFQGVNYFRRALGLIVLIILLANRI